MKKLLICTGLLLCSVANSAFGTSMCKELASLPRGLKVTAGLTCYGISCVSAVVALAKGYDSLFALDDCKEVVTRAKFAAVSIVSAYLGHQIYKHAYTYEAQLAQQKANAAR